MAADNFSKRISTKKTNITGEEGNIDDGSSSTVKYYRLENLDCADCARKFQDLVKKIPGVIDAEVYFAPGKLKVAGNVEFTVLKAVGKQDGIEVLPMEIDTLGNNLTGKMGDHIAASLSGAAIAVGWILSFSGSPWMKAFFLLAIIIGGYETFRKGFFNLIKLRFDMSVLMSVAVIGAVLIGEWAEGATVAFLFSVSDLLESYTADRARQSLRSLMEITSKVASVITEAGEKKVSVEEVRVNDEVLVRPGEKIPVDGIVFDGFSGVNQAPITGESIPVSKSTGNEVFAGTINMTGVLKVRVTKEHNDTTLSRIIRLVEEAQNKKVRVQSYIDRFASYYTPAVMVLAALVILVPPLALGRDWHEWIYRGLTLLVVSCPCSLVITTPVVVVSAIGNAAKNGVLIKGGIHLERLGEVNVAAFDKTGTLTKGFPEVRDVISYQQNENEILELAAGVEKYSEHPLAQAVLRETEKRGLHEKTVSQFKALPGKGAQARIDESLVKVGNIMMFFHPPDQRVIDDMARLESGGDTVVLVGIDDQPVGLIALADDIRNEAVSVVQSLKELKICKTVMVTGDSAAAALAIAARIGIDAVFSEMLPQDKVEKIQSLKKNKSIVMMVGDGINDAPALAAADVSVAMGVVGTDAALEAADIALMADDLSKLPFSLELSRQALRVIKQNIAFALGIKILAIFAVFPGWLTLWIAIMADMGANVLVTLNGMRLVRFKRSLPKKQDEVPCACTST